MPFQQNLCQSMRESTLFMWNLPHYSFGGKFLSCTKINGVKLTEQNFASRLPMIPTKNGIVCNRYETKAQN